LTATLAAKKTSRPNSRLSSKHVSLDEKNISAIVSVKTGGINLHVCDAYKQQRLRQRQRYQQQQQQGLTETTKSTGCLTGVVWSQTGKIA